MAVKHKAETLEVKSSSDQRKLIRTFRVLGWAFLVFGTFAEIHLIQAVLDPTATVNVNRVETSDPNVKLRTALIVGLFPLIGAVLAFLPRRYFQRLYEHNLAAFERLTGSRRQE